MPALEALPEASAPLTSTSWCFGAKAGKEGVADKGPDPGLPGSRAVWTDGSSSNNSGGDSCVGAVVRLAEPRQEA